MRLTKILLACSTGLLFSAAAFAQAPSGEVSEKQLKQYAEMIRKDIRTEKQSVVDQAMGLEAGDKTKFWGIYEKYQKELSALWDQRLANVKKYAENYDKMTDAAADQLATAAMKNEQAGTALRARYYQQFKTAMGPKVAARFLQVETMLTSIGSLQLMSELPLMP
jgi:hypothetical protein